MKSCDVAIIGAGPFGLSVAAHLKARSLRVSVFGRPMVFWDRHMPVGMLLRSPLEASSLSDPEGKLSLGIYLSRSAGGISEPVPLDRFVNYGLWFQQRIVPELDTRSVACLRKDGEFRLTLEDGEEIKALRVVVAAGVGSFANRPKQFAGFPNTMISHSSEHSDLAPFKHRKVAVVGGGQSALESAALLHEAGAQVELLVRSPRLRWLKPPQGLAALPPIERLLWAPAHVGPAGISQLVARPNYYRRLPRRIQDCFAVLPPAGAAWLRPRVEHKIPASLGYTVVSVSCHEDKLDLTPASGRPRRVDHVLLATGYKIDISRYEFIAERLLAAVTTMSGYPQLNSHFESSVPGLHFVGAPAAWSFGPLMKFVAGAEFAAKAVARGVVASGDFKRPGKNTCDIPVLTEFENQEAQLHASGGANRGA
jgi:FAD-dependent urate hydroxylase